MDHLESLEHDDLDTLTVMIKSLHGKLQKDSKPLCTCSNCGNPSAHEAIFCGNCGKKLGHK